ncbi:MAG: tRNA (N(6)-L-threonylcarbamoyladenosine(37)-C(2))-methylthiotransferase MtaB [Lactobacillales bacterium]|jgi:threonylcarbamoyladenosine tRNA methylthiotransferase MtaB|nr:tRNA (N(6)-L-threonylcarbamoyladenosine(37)-C(2))-methylthiotransferase MtaB [Lactobacillales bacterium]
MKVLTFGCRLNAFESVLIKKLGTDIDDNVIVVNTCAVTGEAERQCRQAIRKASRDNPGSKIVVTGCAAQLHPEIYASMPEVAKVLGNREKLEKDSFLSDKKINVSNIWDARFDLPVLSDFEGRSRAFLQIQQGCNHRCSFCVVPMARGKNMGLLPEKIIKQAREFVENGFSELVLTGVDIVSYPYGFTALVDKIIREVPDLKRLRFGSLDPILNDDFIDLVAKYDRIMPHFHLSIQAGSDTILKRMGRRHKRKSVIDFAEKLRIQRPGATLGSDFITGFPTETETDFNQTMDLVERAGLTHLHVFPYSIRPGTPSAKMPQIDIPIRKERAKKLRDLGHKKYESLLNGMVGKEVSVLIEKNGVGLSENNLKVRTAFTDQTGQSVRVKIKERMKDELVG